MSATAEATKTGARCEIGRYDVDGEARVLVGQRIDGVIHVFDQPRCQSGRRYFVEAGFESKRELAVLIADYRRTASRLGRCPMAKGAFDAMFDSTVAQPSPPQDRTA